MCCFMNDLDRDPKINPDLDQKLMIFQFEDLEPQLKILYPEHCNMFSNWIAKLQHV